MAGRALHYTTKFRAMRARNWFGNGGDGNIRITAAGAEQSFTSGVTWAAIPGWLLVGSVVSIPSVQDGDMVVVNARTLTIDAGYTLTVANRCRGLLVYSKSHATINGTISMTGKGCHANPADATATEYTPVPPSDGQPVSEAGLRFGWLVTDGVDEFMVDLSGCGAAAVDAMSNQPGGLGIGVTVPRVGGAGSSSVSVQPPNTSGAAGGGGAAQGAIGAGATGTCFASGAGSGNQTHAAPYGGPAGNNNASTGNSMGNPGGTGYWAWPPDSSWCAGLLALIVGGDLSGSGALVSNGAKGAAGTSVPSGGSTGGGVVIVAYAGTATGWYGSLSAISPATGDRPGSGLGGDGTVYGPYKVDPA